MMTNIQKRLSELADEEYKRFHTKLMPTVDSERVLGVRMPLIRKYGRELAKTDEGARFLKQLPHKFYEENNIHAVIIEQIKDFDTAILETERFLPYIDNWATCDMFVPRVFRKNTDRLAEYIKAWISSEMPYTVRYGIGLLMKLYLDENFDSEYLGIVSAVKSDEYYVNMMIAWYFATALAKRYDETIVYLEKNRLEMQVHNKTIQKAVESNRISAETKAYLKTLKRR